MIVETKYLGFVEAGEEDIITFPHGIYGFEKAVRFLLLGDNNKDNPFMWLQHIDDRDPCFVVADPRSFFSDYDPAITGPMKEMIGLESADNLRLLVIATIPPGDFKRLTLNLKCPIIINAAANTAAQVILEDDRYPMRFPLFPAKEGE